MGDKPSIFAKALESVTSAPSRFYDHMVEKGHESMVKEMAKNGVTQEQVDKAWVNNSIYDPDKLSNVDGGAARKPSKPQAMKP